MSTQSLGVALVTGASTGIGAVYADRLARRGYDLLLVARDEARLASLAARLTADTDRAVEVLRADLTNPADLRAVAGRLSTDPAIAALVNNAGAAVSGALVGGDLDRLDAMIQLNVGAASRLAVTAATAFAARGQGLIVNIASVLALAPERFNGVYSGTKAFLLNLSQALQTELAGTDVRVQAVLPGASRTEIWDRSGGDVNGVDPSVLMEVDDLVDAALAGLDQGELVTIPSLPDPADFDALNAARAKLGPNLSRNRPADRYRVPETV